MYLIIIRGVSGSGKTTAAKDEMAAPRFKEPMVHLEADMFFETPDGKYNFDPEYLHHAHKWCQMSAVRAMRNGSVVIVSNTFTTFKEAEPYLEAARRLGYKLDIRTMNINYGSIHNVPEEVLERQRARMVPHDKFSDAAYACIQGEQYVDWA